MSFDTWLTAIKDSPRAPLPSGGGKKYPYKPLLLASVLAQIGQGKLTRPEVAPSEGTKAIYQRLLKLVYPNWPYGRDPGQPFVRLANDAWTLQPRNHHTHAHLLFASNTSQVDWKQLVAGARCATLPLDVHATLCKDPAARRRLADLLIEQLTQSSDTGPTAISIDGLQQLAAMLSSDTTCHIPSPQDMADELLLESDLERRLLEDWTSTPFHSLGVDLHTNHDGERVAQQYPVGKWWIDVLGWQPQQHCWWVFELKRGRADDRVVGQTSRYLGWVSRYLTHPCDQTQGVILARSATPGLVHAARAVPNLSIWIFDDDLNIAPAA